MATSITQAKPLLTAAEFELFDHSRASPIKAFSAKQLAGKEKRVRALRDKYRDLYRRQTVAQRSKAGKGGAAASEANARTQRKADIMQEVLERFEARSLQVSAREERESARETTRKATDKTQVKAPKKSPVKAAAPQPKQRARPAPAAKSAAPTRKKTADKASVEKAAAKNPAKRAAGTAPAVPSGKRTSKDTEHAISALAHLHDGDDAAVRVDHFNGEDPTQRSAKAPSERAPTYGDKPQAPDINAPLDMVASAKRGNPVRQMPGNIAIQGHQSSAVRRAQGKRDSR